MPSFTTHAASTTALLLGLGTFLFAAPASAQHTPGARITPCDGPTQIAQMVWNAPAIGLGGGQNEALGQSFTAPCTGLLDALSVFVYLLPTPGPVDVTVYEGEGRTGPVRGMNTVDFTGGGWKVVSLGVPVTEGEIYTVVLTVPPGQNTDLALYTSSANPYAGGVEYHALFGSFAAFPGDDLVFRLDFDAMPVSTEPGAGGGADVILGRASPNPVATRATVTLTVARAQDVAVAVYDALGRRVLVVHDGLLGAGPHTLALDAAALLAGVYVIRAGTATATDVQRLVVAR